MKRSKAVFLVVGWIAVLGIGGRQAGADVTPAGGPRPAYSLETDKAVYQLGEEVHAVHRLTNEGDADYRALMLSGPAFDLWVLDDQSEKIWSQHLNFTFGTWWLTVEPGASIVREYTWSMTDYAGNLVSPGQYELVGVIYGDTDVSTQITILPEPATVGLVLAGCWVLALRRRARGSARWT